MGERHVVLPFAFADVYHACGRVAQGEISLAAWLESVTALEQSLEADQQAIAQFHEMVGADAESAAAYDEVSTHLAQALKALATLRAYATDRDVAHLNDGWTMLAAAAVALRDVLTRVAQDQQQAPDGKAPDWGEA
ncbi:MAG: hypothetical protein FJX76_00975 [Armatimonadetes bacterium]|nr:hypothetical protein [Armatimonadota bacterium]